MKPKMPPPLPIEAQLAHASRGAPANQVKPTTKSAKPQPPAPQGATPFPIHIRLILAVDGQPKAQITFDVEVTQPPIGQGVELGFPIDTKQLAALIEPLIGPGAPVAQPKTKIWTPR